jgi:hypothetical protein
MDTGAGQGCPSYALQSPIGRKGGSFFKANIYSVSRQSGYSEEQVFTNHNRERSRVLGRGRRRDLEGGGGA